MTKTLIVSHLPRHEISNTQILVDYLKSKISGEIEEIDLEKSPAPEFTDLSLIAYEKRNYNNQELNASEAEAIKPFDQSVEKLIESDVLVIAVPMYNFSFTGPIKTYFDSVILFGKTFHHTENPDGTRKYAGLMENKKAIVIYTTGGNYKEGTPIYHLNMLEAHMKIMFNFMGFGEYKFITAATATPATKEKFMNEAKQDLDKIIEAWY